MSDFQPVIVSFLDLVVLHAIIEATREGRVPRQRDLLLPRERGGFVNDILFRYQVDPWRQKPLTSVSTFTRSVAKLRFLGLLHPRLERESGFRPTGRGCVLLDALGSDPAQWPRSLPFEYRSEWMPALEKAEPVAPKPAWASNEGRE